MRMRKKLHRMVGHRLVVMTEAFMEFFRQEASSGLVLLGCALLAMGLANSPWAAAYEAVLHYPLCVGWGDVTLSISLLHWINDGLMALFFFVIGMEIKREFLFGELKSLSATVLPIAAAVGGMVVPALIYAGFNLGQPTLGGWGVPMATDIAFALGILSFAAGHAPRSVAVFLTALAIVDDLGGIVVIALFYTAKLQVMALAAGMAVFAVLWFLARRGVHSVLPYLFGGVAAWYAFLLAGIHPTIAGVLLGFLIPAGRARFMKRYPLYRWEHKLAPWSAYLVMPVFALANAGIPLSLAGFGNLVSPIGLGVLFGLCVGKPLGIFGSVRAGSAGYCKASGKDAARAFCWGGHSGWYRLYDGALYCLAGLWRCGTAHHRQDGYRECVTAFRYGRYAGIQIHPLRGMAKRRGFSGLTFRRLRRFLLCRYLVWKCFIDGLSLAVRWGKS